LAESKGKENPMKALRHGVAVLGVTLAIPAVAQMDMTEVATKVSQARQANAQKARDYSWTQCTEAMAKGETKSLNGELQKTPIDETSAKKPRGVRGKDDDAWYFTSLSRSSVHRA